ncbi:tRNA-splicing endonuclease subunit Sen2 isoform X1 [Erpetoichthys calabaricus]|nr:tRNA-splicing endonuclease subunit Sen2 isoform X1 [Erpetoichthys calabaricus]
MRVDRIIVVENNRTARAGEPYGRKLFETHQSMAEAVFQAPKRRLKVYESYLAPFPIHTSSDEGKTKVHKVYRAELFNQHVIVTDPEDIEALYARGFFGKGILSRSRPDYSISDRWHNDGLTHMPVISSAKYQLHLSWVRQILYSQGIDEEAVEKILERYTEIGPLTSAEGVLTLNDQSEELNSLTAMDEHNMDGTVSKNCKHSPSELEQQPSSPHRKKPRRQGDPKYDPLAEMYAQEPEPIDQDALSKVKCERHDDFLVHCGCHLQEQVLTELTTISEPSVRPAFSNKYEYVLVKQGEDVGKQVDLSQNKNSPRLVCKINPYRVIEYLQLSLEEAFFLVYALGCLSVYFNKEPLTILKLWEVFSDADPNFRPKYMVYHHFRSKGWVPKPGMKYGTDFLLYRKGPPFYHASYSVVVEMADSNSQGSVLRPFCWRSLAALGRITLNVSKELMLCYVIRPADLTEEAMSSPECMRHIKIQEVIVSRWVSSRERTEHEELQL